MKRLCRVMDFSAANASLAGLDKAVIVFTDGKNDGPRGRRLHDRG